MPSIAKQIEAIDEKIAALKAERDALQRRRLARCSTCKKGTQIGSLTYYQMMEYEPPSGCMGGDYLYEGEGRFLCPKCSAVNRLYYREQDGKIVYQGHPDAKLLTSLRVYFKDEQRVRER